MSESQPRLFDPEIRNVISCIKTHEGGMYYNNKVQITCSFPVHMNQLAMETLVRAEIKR